MRRAARLCWFVHRHRWSLAAANVTSAALFVIGCIGFFWPRLYAGAVTVFLIGSVLFLVSALGSALVEHGPSA